MLPLAALFLTFCLGGYFWLNVLLSILAYIPGLVHAV